MILNRSTLVLILLALSLNLAAQASLLILETTDARQPEHGQLVSSVACPGSPISCQVDITDFNADFLMEFIESLSLGDVVNMSFGYQRIDDSPLSRNNYEALVAQGLTVDDYTEVFDERETLFRQMMANNPETLFVSAAGNGQRSGGFAIPGGVPVGPRYKIYPVFFEYDNLIKVTAANVSSFDPDSDQEYRIPEYANFSTDYVDVAAPVETEEIGTSFAAPYVARLGDEIKEEYGTQLLTKDMKSIFLKSCFVQDLDQTLELTRAYQADPRGSVIGRIQNMHLNGLERRELINSISSVMLVKCGGVISSQVAKDCAERFVSAGGALTTSQACLQSQSAIFKFESDRLQKIEAFWQLQEI